MALRISGTFWDQNHDWLSAKKRDIIGAYWEKKIDFWGGAGGGTFWDQNHNWLSAKQDWKMLDNIAAKWEKRERGLDHLWHFLDIIGEKEKKDSRGGGGFWDQNQYWLSAKQVWKMLDIITVLWEKKG